MGHDHDHGARTGRAFAISVGVNGAFVLIELVAGLLSSSVALVADAAHNFGDVLGLVLAWGAARLARRKPTGRRTYGLRRSTILAALANGVLLVLAVGAVAWESIERLRVPAAPQGLAMLVVAGAGIVVNTGSALLFLRDRKRDANVRGAFLHLVADALVSAGVVVAGGALLVTRWTWIDPAMSLLVSVVILAGTWSLLRDALNLALDAAPAHVDVDAVRAHLAALPAVRGVHDLHIWALSTSETALTGHLVMAPADRAPTFLRDVARELEQRFEIHHTTIQIESPEEAGGCEDCETILPSEKRHESESASDEAPHHDHRHGARLDGVR
ncbi:MAG: cation transporter [Labilithrix sp.]|nr:cation transporter [Labilithrix sp.]MCW5817060.1 cation transporter [Labilithrix sp.]